MIHRTLAAQEDPYQFGPYYGGVGIRVEPRVSRTVYPPCLGSDAALITRCGVDGMEDGVLGRARFSVLCLRERYGMLFSIGATERRTRIV